MKLSLAAVIAVGLILPALARDNGWEGTPPHVRQWYQSLMQPDAPAVSCCGEADAYWADDFEVVGDQYVAIVTDDRGDTFSNGATRPHIPLGTRIRVPNGKVKFDQSNPTGHGVIFMGAGTTIYCYLPPAGI
jgi:hypothetical protein